MTTTLDVLKKARKLVATRWTQGAYRNVLDGKVCYCAMGALAKVCGARVTKEGTRGGDIVLIRAALDELLQMPSVPWSRLIAFNDKNDQADVLELFDNAISNLTPVNS